MKFRFDLVTTQKSFSSVSAAGRDLGQRGGERSKLKARPGASVPQSRLLLLSEISLLKKPKHCDSDLSRVLWRNVDEF
jgi:hypothetical protein